MNRLGGRFIVTEAVLVIAKAGVNMPCQAGLEHRCENLVRDGSEEDRPIIGGRVSFCGC